MTDKPTPTDAATPECLTCSDHGAVGNILTAEPCPDCTRLNAQPAPATRQAGIEALVSFMNERDAKLNPQPSKPTGPGPGPRPSTGANLSA